MEILTLVLICGPYIIVLINSNIDSSVLLGPDFSG